jgi:hypothetical protein
MARNLNRERQVEDELILRHVGAALKMMQETQRTRDPEAAIPLYEAQVSELHTASKAAKRLIYRLKQQVIAGKR